MNKFSKNDFKLIGILIGICLALFVGVLILGKDGSMVEVSVDGNTFASYDLTVDGQYEISGINGGTNLLIVANREAYVADASCPDHLCMNMGKISKNGESIICLPNRVVVTIVSKENGKFDAVAN